MRIANVGELKESSGVFLHISTLCSLHSIKLALFILSCGFANMNQYIVL